MSAMALILVLIASIAHAWWNFLAKRSGGGIPFIWLTYFGSTLIFLPAMVWLIFQRTLSFSADVLFVIMVSAMLRLFYFLILQTGYRKADLSVVYPVARGSAPLFSACGAIVILNETPTWHSIAGLALIVTGVIVISDLKFKKPNSPVQSGLFFGLATGMLTGIYTLWDKQAISDYQLSPLFLTFASHSLGLVVLAPEVMRQKENLRQEVKTKLSSIVLISLLSPLSYLLVLIAMKTTSIIYIAPAREVSIIFGVWMGKALIAEKDGSNRITGAILIFAGIIFLAV